MKRINLCLFLFTSLSRLMRSQMEDRQVLPELRETREQSAAIDPANPDHLAVAYEAAQRYDEVAAGV